MIDEQRHDLAIEYLFGHLEGEAQREFESWLQSDDELRTLVDDLRETTAAIALSAPQVQPPPQLRARVLQIPKGETATAVTVPFPAPAPRRLGWIPWAIAAGLAITAAGIYSDREKWRAAADSARADYTRSLAEINTVVAQTGKLTGRLEMLDAQTKTHLSQIAELRDEVVKLRGRDALAQMQIAALSAQVAEFEKAGVIIVWDPSEQRGIVKMANLPKPETGKDYQLWVIDPKYQDPVNGGILTVAEAGQTRVAFKPDQLIEHADKFAISIEQAGGVPKAQGPIIFVGQ